MSSYRGKATRWRSVLRAVAATFVTVALVGGTVAVSTVTTTDAATAASASLPGWLHTSGASIKTSAGKTYVIKGVAWFGMETETCSPHGLWTTSLDAGLARIRSMGFNTIRLPFSNECLAATAANSIDPTLNPTLVALTPLQIMDRVVARAKVYGLNVILDQHRPDSAAQSALWYTAQYSESRWIADWKALAKRYRTATNVIGFDLHNEPHGSACWGCGVPALDWKAAATRAGNAVLAVNSHVLVIVEGVDHTSAGYYWWGGALADAGSKPVVLKRAHRVVYSPHDYPSSIYSQSWFSAAAYPANLAAVWTKNWGYLDKKNVAPILLGEFGTKLETASDKQWLSSMVSYLKTNKMSFAYWSFNPDSGDTGGIVQDDWTTPQALKLRYLAPLLGTGTAVTEVAPTATSTTTTPTATTTPTSTETTAPTTSWGDGVPSAGWSLLSSWSDGYVAQVVVSSDSGTSHWSVSWPDTTATSVVSAWGMTCSLAQGVSITCTGADWASSIAAGQSVTVGLQVADSSAPVAPALSLTN